MTPEQTVKLIKALTEKRTSLHLSTNEVARRAKLDPVAVWRIEQGMVKNPRAESLIAIGRALGLNVMEIFTTVGWLTPDDLPSLESYMHAKYADLPESAVEDIAHYIATTMHSRRSQARSTDIPSVEHYPAETTHCPGCHCPPKEC